MQLTVTNYFSSLCSSPSISIFLAAITAITYFTGNVSCEISNHIEEMIKETPVVAEEKQLEKSLGTEIKSNDTENYRRSRYLRLMPPSAYRPMQPRSAEVAVAAAVASDELSNPKYFRRFPKYRNGPFDGRKYPPNRLPPPRYRMKSRYRYFKDTPTSFPSYPYRGGYSNFAAQDELPYDDYYEDVDKENEADWFTKNREPYEDAEPALSSKYSVGKRVPLSNYDFDFYATAPNFMMHGDNNMHIGGQDGGNDFVKFYGKKFKFNRGSEGYPEPDEWLGAKRNVKPGRLHGRPTNSFSTYKFQQKYSPYEAFDEPSPIRDENHRFKINNIRNHPLKNFHRQNNQDNENENEREENYKSQRRNKQRDRNRYSLSSIFGEDDSNRYETDSSSVSDQENGILAVKRRPAQQIDEDIVYSSRYRNKHNENIDDIDDDQGHSSKKRKSTTSNDDQKSNVSFDMDEIASKESQSLIFNHKVSKPSTNSRTSSSTSKKSNDHVPSRASISDTDQDRDGETETPVSDSTNTKFKSDHITTGELIAYMSASPSEPVVNKQDRFAMLGYPFVSAFSDSHDKQFYKPLLPVNEQDYEINLDQYGADEWKNK